MGEVALWQLLQLEIGLSSPFVDDMPSSFQGFPAVPKVPLISFSGDWQPLHRSRQHYGPSQELSALFATEPGHSRCTMVYMHNIWVRSS